MNSQDAQKLLDEMLPQFDEYKRNINANKKLSDSEKDDLYDIVIDMEMMSGKYNYTSAIGSVKAILNTHSPVIKKGNKCSRPKVIPFLVIQEIFYITVNCVDYMKNLTAVQIIAYWRDFFNVSGRNPKGYTQTNVLQDLELSHNFFSKLQRTPKEYSGMKNYKQPESVIPYNGHKDGTLGTAIKYLAYQAGKYDYYIDLFGGSGAASTAVSRRNNVEYVYNEKDKFVFNLFDVIADDLLHVELIESLEALQADLRGEKTWLDVDFDAEIDKFYNRNNKKPETADEETRIKEEYSQDIFSDYKDIIEYMWLLYVSLVEQERTNVYHLRDGREISVGELLDYYIYDASKYRSLAVFSYFSNYRMLEDIAKESWTFLKGTTKNVGGKNIPKFVYEKKQEYFEYRFYKYFAYFENHYKIMSKKPQFNYGADKVLAAVAAVFAYGIAVRGNIGISAIVRMLYGAGGAKGSTRNIIESFKGKDFRQLITDLHKVVEGTDCQNKDFKDIIKGYKSQANNKKHPLFYSDSPYISTTGYELEFTEDDMVDLIRALLNSGDKFIFSCRAVYGAENGVKPSKDNQKKNEVIYNTVFKTFSSYLSKGHKLYVLYIDKKNRDLKKTIKGGYNDEIMITNYEIKSFIDCNNKGVSYTVHDFKYLLETIIQYGDLGYTPEKKQDALKEISRL